MTEGSESLPHLKPVGIPIILDNFPSTKMHQLFLTVVGTSTYFNDLNMLFVSSNDLQSIEFTISVTSGLH